MFRRHFVSIRTSKFRTHLKVSLGNFIALWNDFIFVRILIWQNLREQGVTALVVFGFNEQALGSICFYENIWLMLVHVEQKTSQSSQC